MGIFSNSSSFDSLLDKATSQLQLEPDWNLILQICDSIRQEDVNPKYAVAALKKKIFDKNPHVAKFALIVLEVCVKNCGSPIHKEVATKELMDSFRELVKTGPEPVKEQVLSMIQMWSHAFRKESKYKWVQDTYNLMKMEGYKFPSLDKSSDALFTAETAPEWAEGDVCHMCRVKFSTFQRQHHCRSCGQVFCQKCSSKVSIIPQYGIEREVRVCDPCYYKLNPGQSKSEDGTSKKSESSSSTDPDLPPEYVNSPLSKETQIPAKKSSREIQEEEEEELQLAMALSLSEEEATKESRLRPSLKSSSYSASEVPYSSCRQTSCMYSSAINDVEQDSSNMDPELQRYLNRSYWEERNDRQSSRGRLSPLAGAPETLNGSSSDVDYTEVDDNNAEVSEAMVKNFYNSVEMLLDRMQKVSGQGKHIAMDATIQSLFQTVSAIHPQILRLMEEQDQAKAKYEALHEKLGVVRKARASLEEMREQHQEKVHQQELEQDMLRRMQIEQKLELMRQQKAEYLAYQQRLQTERQAAIEQQQQQQKLQYQRQMQQQYGAAHYMGGDSSPYSSLTYVPMTAPSSQPYNTQGPAVPYTHLAPAGYQVVPDAPPPSKYTMHTQADSYLQNSGSDYMPYRAEASAPQTDSQPNSIEYQATSIINQPPSYTSQVPPEQGAVPLQHFSVLPPSQVVPTAPPAVYPQVPPPQYAQVTSQQQPTPLSQYGQNGTLPSSQFNSQPPSGPAGQPPFNQMPPQGQSQYQQQAQPQPPPQQPQYSQQQQQQQQPQQPIPLDPTQPQAPQTLSQSFQPPSASGFQSFDPSKGSPQAQFLPGQMQPQANMAASSGPQPFHQQVAPVQQVYEPQQQQPQQFAPQPLTGQPQPPSQQYYGSAPPSQPSGSAPQRQMSDLELISFD